MDQQIFALRVLCVQAYDGMEYCIFVSDICIPESETTTDQHMIGHSFFNWHITVTFFYGPRYITLIWIHDITEIPNINRNNGKRLITDDKKDNGNDDGDEEEEREEEVVEVKKSSVILRKSNEKKKQKER